MRKLILTISSGEFYQKMTLLTHPLIKSYANKIGAEFICINEKTISKTTIHWEKFQIYDLLDKYNRIIYLDTDLIIRNDCPDLFTEVPEDKLGMFDEAKFTDRSKELMIDICNKYNEKLPTWNGKYFNSGVMVVSETHKKLFKKPDKEEFSFYEQSYLNMMIAKLNIEMYELHYKFNRMPCLDSFTGEERHNSYIIHYAGFPDPNLVLNLIEKDIEKWHIDKEYIYRKHIYISVSGGLGDQICAEPAIRYMKEKQYPNDEVVVATHYPRIFEHIRDIDICIHGKANLPFDTPYYIAQSLPGPDTIQWMIVSHLLCHTVDYASIALMKRMLPVTDKRLHFEIKEKDYFNLNQLIDWDTVKNYIVVHPGKHWRTKTLPKEYWQKIIDGLIINNKIVIIIGKDQEGDPPDYNAGARGTVDINPQGTVDLRNKLNLGELGALLSRAQILISNDSAPVHLAGAFDNWIVLLPTCKHPDHVLPYRNGSVNYKTLAIYKKLIIDDVESRPTQVYPTTVDIAVNDWNKYLESPDIVIENVLKLQGKD
jgi:hypothetical protein